MARVSLTEDVLGDDEPPRRPTRAKPSEPEPEPEPAPAPAKPQRWKFTMLVDQADDERAHAVVDDVVRRAGIRPTKSMRADVVRALFAIAEHDTRLRDAVAARLRDGMTS